MGRTMLAVVMAIGIAGCLSGGPVDSYGNPIVEGEWVLAPSVSTVPVLADEVPEGVMARPVDLVLLEDGAILVVCDVFPTSGALGEGGEGGETPGVMRPGEATNAPAQRVGGDPEANVATGPAPADAASGGTHETERPLGGVDIERLLPGAQDVYRLHRGCL